jgi:hypothetical protein
MSNDMAGSMYGLYAGGQFKEWSMPVAEARAIVGVPHTIDSDGEDQPEQDRAARAQSNKRSRSETASAIFIKRSNLDRVIEVPHRMNFFYEYPFESKVSALAKERTWNNMIRNRLIVDCQQMNGYFFFNL